MSVHRKGRRWVVRWRAEGRQRSRSFPTKREAAEYERDRRSDMLRDSIARPTGTVSMQAADRITSFLVCEDVFQNAHLEGRSAQRQVHDGYFTTIRDADAYRQQMPDADALRIMLSYKRYPFRDLSDAEIAAGEVGPDELDDLRRQIDGQNA